MYTLHIQNGTVTRDSDGFAIAPAQTTETQDYQDYISWIQAGNSPTIVDQPVLENKFITVEMFRLRFTTEEMTAVIDAAYNGDTACRQLLFKLSTNVSGIDLISDTVIYGLQYLKSIGILTDERITEITQ